MNFWEENYRPSYLRTKKKCHITSTPKSLFLLDQEYLDVREVKKYRGIGGGGGGAILNSQLHSATHTIPLRTSWWEFGNRSMQLHFQRS